MDAIFRKETAIISILLVSSFASVPFSVLAQDHAGDNEQLMLEEVVVTARKREESLQDSPVAVSAFSAETLRESGVSTMRDLSTAVPGLSFSEQGSKATSIFIRGVGQRESNTTLDPSVGVYINGIFIARTDTQLLDTVDTQSVQVLRGPQGTLFGKNTTAGALLVTTKSPNTEAFSGSVGTRLGNYGRRDAKLFLNIPLDDDSLSARIGLNSVKRDGYMDNVVNSREFGDEDRLAATARVLWEANDVFSVDLFTYFSKQNENGAAFTCRFANPEGTITSQLSYPGPAGSSTLANFREACEQSEALEKDNKVALNKSSFKLTNQMVGLTLAWDLDDFEVKSITGFGHQKDILIEDDTDGMVLEAIQNGGLTLKDYVQAAGLSYDDEKRTQLSQEINIVGTALDESLSYTAGLFYSKEEMDNTPFTQAVGPGTFAMVSALQGVSTHKFLGTQSDLDMETSALFAQGTYDITDWFQLTVGARYTAEKRERALKLFNIDWRTLADRSGGTYVDNTLIQGIDYGSIAAFNNAASAQANGQLAIPLVEQTGDKRDDTWSKFTPAVTLSFNNLENYLDWDNLDKAMVYFTYSKGFKAGGFEPRDVELRKFDPEEVENYELGAKFDAFNHRLRINSALYYMDESDMQVRIAEAGTRVSDLYLYLTNAGEATIQGFELELTALPFENLTIAATFNYTDASYDEFMTRQTVLVNGIPQDVTQDRSGEPFAVTPEKSGSLTVSYNIGMEGAGLFIPRLTASYRDEIYIGTDYLSPKFDQAYIDSYTLLSARLTWMPDDQWNFAAFVDNLTDKEYFQGGFGLADAVGASTVVKGPRRMYGIEAYYDF